MPDARTEKTVRWIARGLGSAFVVVFLAFFIGESLTPTPSETTVDMQWYDYTGLALMGVGLVGFVVAWWRPMLGGRHPRARRTRPADPPDVPLHRPGRKRRAPALVHRDLAVQPRHPRRRPPHRRRALAPPRHRAADRAHGGRRGVGG